MRLPEKLKVGGKTYTVNVTDRLALGMDYAAEILYTAQEINIRPAAPEHMAASFLHEMVHAIFDHMGHKSHDEIMVDGIAQALHMIITDNPGLFSQPLGGSEGPGTLGATPVCPEAEKPVAGGCEPVAG